MYVVQDCKTAEEVMTAARRVIECRDKWFSKPKPVSPPLKTPSFEELVDAAYPKDYPRVSDQLSLPLQPSIAEITRSVCAAYKITRNDMISKRRDKLVVTARHVAQAICKRLTAKSFPEIGRRFGGRDHTTVLHAVRRMQPIIDAVQADLQGDASLALWVQRCKHYADALPRQKRRKPNERIQVEAGG